MKSAGVLDISAETREKIRQGEQVASSAYYFRIMLMFETGADRYRWLNRLVAADVGKHTPTGMSTSGEQIRDAAAPVHVRRRRRPRD